MKIKNIIGRQILDSRGNPTVEAEVILENGLSAIASVPSGVSTGSREALELRDNDSQLFFGRSVMKAVQNVNTEIRQSIVGQESLEQEKIDQTLIALDGSPNKSRLGANAILAVSVATAKAAALSAQKPLYVYLAESYGTPSDYILPVPMVNIINGGKHALRSTDIQEFMVMPVGATSFNQATEMSAGVFHALGDVIRGHGYATTVGDEGGYAPTVRSGNQEALSMLSESIIQAGYKVGDDFVMAIDVAASQLYHEGRYELKTENKSLTREEMIIWLENLTKQYPVVSIEDGLVEDDWEGWAQMTRQIGQKIQLVGDDLLVTNTAYLSQAVNEKAGNTILIKPNQIGTLTETVSAARMAKQAGWQTIIAHRSGETEDTFITHLAVGLAVGQVKIGSVSRTDRTCKYNELLRIEESLAGKGRYVGRDILNRS